MVATAGFEVVVGAAVEPVAGVRVESLKVCAVELGIVDVDPAALASETALENVAVELMAAVEEADEVADY